MNSSRTGVAASISPKTVNPIVDLAWAPAPVASAKGDTPKINAIEVIIIGRKRNLTASIVAAVNSIPFLSALSFANSTISIAFFAFRRFEN
ncbi:MAG: hypothetical protein P4L27_11705 [Ignavibacteriaceae bacterium]|nr:hypothetical protein [Ignavibacteriaceae bacterium]